MSSPNDPDPAGSKKPERMDVGDIDAHSDSTLSAVSTPTSSPETLRRPAMNANESDTEDAEARESEDEMEVDVPETLNPESPSTKNQSRKSTPSADDDATMSPVSVQDATVVKDAAPKVEAPELNANTQKPSSELKQDLPKASSESLPNVISKGDEVVKQSDGRMNLDESGSQTAPSVSAASPAGAPVDAPTPIINRDPIGTKLTGEKLVAHKKQVQSLTEFLDTLTPEAALAGITEYTSKKLFGQNTIGEIYFAVKCMNKASDRALSSVLKHAEQRLLEVADEQCKNFLDRAVEIRVESIESMKLVKFLSQAKRLGFEEDDIVENENVAPKAADIIRAIQAQNPQQGPMGQMPLPPQFAPYQNYQFTNYGSPYVQQVPGTVPSAHMGLKSCDYCGQTFKQNAGLRYHLEKGVCRKDAGPQGPVMATCPTCGKEFRSPGGYHYVSAGDFFCTCVEMNMTLTGDQHVTNKVCDHLAQENKSSPAAAEAATEALGEKGEQDEEAEKHDKDEKDEQDKGESKESPKVPSPTAPKATLPALQPARPPLHSMQSGHLTPSGTSFQPGNFIVKSQPAPSHTNSPVPLSMAPPAAHFDPTVQVQRPMPPVRGPVMAVMSAIDGGIGFSQHPMPELTPEVAHKLNEALKAEDAKFEEQMAKLPGELRGEALKAEIKRLKAGMSTRKSNLRRKHNIFVRKTDKAPANAVRNDDGTISVVPAGVHVSVGAGFAPINRPDPPVGSRNTPTMSSNTPTSGLQGPAHPPPIGGEPDAKRQRLSNGPPGTPNYGPPPNGFYPPHQFFSNQPVPYMSSPYSQDPNAAYHQQAYQQMYGQPYMMNTIIRAPNAPGGPPGHYPPTSGFVPINAQHPINTQHVSPYGPPPTQPPATATPTPAAQTPIPSVEQPAQQQPFYVDQARKETNGHGHPKPALDVSKDKGKEKDKPKPKIDVDDAQKLWKDQKQIWKVNNVAKENGVGKFSKFSVRKDFFDPNKNGVKDGEVIVPRVSMSQTPDEAKSEDGEVIVVESGSESPPETKTRKSLPARSSNGDGEGLGAATRKSLPTASSNGEASGVATRKSGRASLPNSKAFAAINGEGATKKSPTPRTSPRRTRKSAVMVKSDSEDTDPEK